MFFKTLLSTIHQAADGDANSPLRDLYSVPQMRRILQRERARAERSGDVFSLVTFSITGAHAGDACLYRLAEALQQRLRITDDIGWLDHRRLAAVLPATGTAGAWKVADDVCHMMGKPFPACRVYCYPSEIWQAETESEAGLGQESPRARPVEAMETLFLQGLPPWKRILDVAVAGTALVLLLPLFVLVALAVKLTSRGPVLFRQTRAGLGGEPFAMYKFRTMVVDAEKQKEKLLRLNEQQGPVFKMRHDPRITPLGRILRKTSIDELPQLVNVLKGQMSLVGPRPPLHKEVQQYEPWQRRRLDVTPGLTCIWQVRGRSEIPFIEWMRMDVQYVQSRSLARDLGLLLRTLPVVVSGRGAH